MNNPKGNLLQFGVPQEQAGFGAINSDGNGQRENAHPILQGSDSRRFHKLTTSQFVSIFASANGGANVFPYQGSVLHRCPTQTANIFHHAYPLQSSR